MRSRVKAKAKVELEVKVKLKVRAKVPLGSKTSSSLRGSRAKSFSSFFSPSSLNAKNTALAGHAFTHAMQLLHLELSIAGFLFSSSQYQAPVGQVLITGHPFPTSHFL